MRVGLVIAVLWSLSFTGLAQGQTLPTGFSATTFNIPINPTCFRILPDGRILIGGKNGVIRVWKEGVGVISGSFYALTVYGNGESGLLGMDIDPDFESNGFVYVHYTSSPLPRPNTISRITVSPPSADVAVAGSEVVLASLGNGGGGIHNGGCLRFGPDGKLYASVGEGSVGSRSQSLDTLQGKILRYNSDGTIPDDNPTSFSGVIGSPSGENRAAWAIGLRNPFRFVFDSESGRMFANDVGGAFEEINEIRAGQNYGHPATSGSFDSAAFPDFTQPVYAYPHSTTGNTAITAGRFYKPGQCVYPPEYYGAYFFGDHQSGWIKRLNPETGVASDFVSFGGLVDFELDASGRLLALSDGMIRRYQYDQPISPEFVSNPRDLNACIGTSGALSVVVASSTPLTYQWQRDGIEVVDGGPIEGAMTRKLIFSDLAANHSGVYRCRIQYQDGEALSEPATVIVENGTAKNSSDIQRFVESALQGATSPLEVCLYDYSQNEIVDLDDIPGLVQALIE